LGESFFVSPFDVASARKNTAGARAIVSRAADEVRQALCRCRADEVKTQINPAYRSTRRPGKGPADFGADPCAGGPVFGLLLRSNAPP